MRPGQAVAERLGLPVRDLDLLEQALVHSSWLHEHPDAARGHNERLEFLGDAVVNLTISEALYARHPDDDEGALSARRAAIVSTTGLARLAGRIGLGADLLLGEGESQRSGRRRPSLLASSFEALTGALYLDLGYEPRPRLADRAGLARARRWRRRSSASRAPRAGCRSTRSGAPGERPEYRLLDATGPDHEKSFRIEVWVDGEVLGVGEGPSRRVAETAAAAQAIERIRAQRSAIAARRGAERMTDGVDARSAPAGRARRPARRPGPWPAGPRLLALRLQGFKSFAERTNVEFGGGISAVVGPNGSGKSNLADALRWALGEQGRALRSRKAEDVIWAGSEKRSAQGMADVTLVLDNADGLLPVDFQVLELGRRLFRSGENEYLLNKQRIRLRDLVDLLDGAHLADNAFLFIGQGMVDQALALRPEERRPLFEEVAGRPSARAPPAQGRGAAGRVRGEPRAGRRHPGRAAAAGPPAGRPGRTADDALEHRR